VQHPERSLGVGRPGRPAHYRLTGKEADRDVEHALRGIPDPGQVLDPGGHLAECVVIERGCSHSFLVRDSPR